MVSKSKKRRSSKGITVDFTGVEATSRTVEDGVYKASIVEIEQKESDNGEYLSFKWEVQMKKSKATIYDNASLQPQALWRLKLLLESLGETCDGEYELNTDDLIGREAKVEVVNEKYNGKNQPRITGFIPLSDDDDSEGEEESESEEEEEEEKPTKKSSKKKTKDEDEDEEEEESEDDNEEEEDDEEEEEPKKGSKKKLKVGQKVWFKDEKKKIKGVITSIDDDTATVEDAEKDEWSVEISELNLA